MLQDKHQKAAKWSSWELACCQPGRGPTLWAFRWANQRFHEQPVKKEMVKRQFARRKMSRCWKLSLKLPWNDLLLHKSLYSFFLIMLSSPSKPSNKPTCRSRLIASAWSELSLPLPGKNCLTIFHTLLMITVSAICYLFHLFQHFFSSSPSQFVSQLTPPPHPPVIRTNQDDHHHDHKEEDDHEDH